MRRRTCRCASWPISRTGTTRASASPSANRATRPHHIGRTSSTLGSRCSRRSSCSTNHRQGMPSSEEDVLTSSLFTLHSSASTIPPQSRRYLSFSAPSSVPLWAFLCHATREATVHGREAAGPHPHQRAHGSRDHHGG